MSQWRCKTDEGELGPVSFEELAGLVREGKVKEGSQVSRAGTMNWEPAWHVPGLLRAAGIVEPGDSPAVERQRERDGEIERSRPGEALGQLPGEQIQNPKSKIQNLVRGIVAAAIGVLAVGFFYRWAWQATIAFPMPPTEVDGELIDCYFPVVGRCTMLECGLLYLDVFAVAAAATWYAAGKRVDGRQ